MGMGGWDRPEDNITGKEKISDETRALEGSFQD